MKSVPSPHKKRRYKHIKALALQAEIWKPCKHSRPDTLFGIIFWSHTGLWFCLSWKEEKRVLQSSYYSSERNVQISMGEVIINTSHGRDGAFDPLVDCVREKIFADGISHPQEFCSPNSPIVRIGSIHHTCQQDVFRLQLSNGCVLNSSQTIDIIINKKMCL